MNKINKKIIKFIIIAPFLIILIAVFIKKDAFSEIKKENKYFKMGYTLCGDDFSCPIKKFADCQKSYFKIKIKNAWIEEKTYEENGKCVFYIIKSDGKGMECKFPKEIVNQDIANKLKISNYYKNDLMLENCKLIQLD